MIADRRESPGKRIRVLVVDDSVVMRKLLTMAMSQEQDIEVVGSASNGELALRRVEQFEPDVMTLDIEMPVMDGLETLRRVRKIRPELRVIMCSAHTERGAGATMEALSHGASDYITKTLSNGDGEGSVAKLRAELLPKVRQLSRPRERTASAANRNFSPPSVPRLRCLPQAVVIGVSTGGPNTLAAVLPMFPPAFHLPILIVQHMPAVFTRLLAERLDTLTPLSVREASAGMPVTPGNIFIAPGDHHLCLRRNSSGTVITELNQQAPENSCRPAVDVLFRSAAEVYGGAVIAVVLTGMGNDGTKGAALLRSSGAHVIAQDEASSVIWGMPRSVVEAGLADSVLDVHSVVPEILKIA